MRTVLVKLDDVCRSILQKMKAGEGGEAEVDFIIEQEGNVVPIEVKAREHTRSRSLSVFHNKYKAEKTIRFSSRNFGWENSIESIPLYAAWLV
jgi:uncharacterized protein